MTKSSPIFAVQLRFGLGRSVGIRFRGLGGGLRLALAFRLCLVRRLLAVGQDFGDPDQRELLAGAPLPARILAPALLEGDHLRPAAVLDHFGRDTGAGDRIADNRRVAAHQQHFGERNDRARLAVEPRNLQLVVRGDTVLLAAGFDDCEHFCLAFDPGARTGPDRLFDSRGSGFAVLAAGGAQNKEAGPKTRAMWGLWRSGYRLSRKGPICLRPGPAPPGWPQARSAHAKSRPTPSPDRGLNRKRNSKNRMGPLDTVSLSILLGAALVLAGILSSLVAMRFGAPLLLVFLILGMAGEVGLGIKFNDVRTAYLVGSVALALILFDGGLRTRFSTFRSVLGPALTLATIGVLISAVLTAPFAHHALGLGWKESVLVGAMVASTDAAAVFFLIHARGLRLRPRVGATLEVESGTNDPFAIFLTLTLV